MSNRWKVTAIAFLCAIAVLSTGFSAVTMYRLKQLEDNVSMVQHSVTSIDSDINSTLNSAITTITQSAEKNASIVADYQVKWGECSHDENTMQVTIRIMPKEYSDQTQVRVRYEGHSVKGQGYDMVFDSEGFEEQSAEAVRKDSGIYEANMTIPLADYITLTAEVQDGSVVRQEKLNDQYSAWGLYLLHPQMSGGFDSYSVNESDKSTIDYTAHASMSMMTSYDVGGVADEPQMTGGSISICLNGEEFFNQSLSELRKGNLETAENPVLEKKDGEVYKVWNSDKSEYPFKWRGKISGLKDGDIVTFVMRLHDENGFTYEQEIDRTVFYVENGWIKGSDGAGGSSEILIK